MLSVDGSPNFQLNVRHALEHLDPSAELINGTVSFDPGIGCAGHQRGHELLRRLVQSAFRVVIVEGPTSKCVPTNRQVGRCGSQVIWRPGQMPSNAPACFCIGLGHELGHADQLIRGIVGSSDLFPARGGSGGFSLRLEMLNITGRFGSETWDGITENQLRQEHFPRCTMRRAY